MTFRTPRLQIIIPKETTNLITNPSIEIDTTGHTASNGSIARSTSYQRRGVASLEITPNTGAEAGDYYAVSLANGVQYTFSVDVLDVAGQTFNIWFANTSGTLKGTAVSWVGTGYWKRRAVTWTADSSTTFRVYVTRSSVASTTKFYLDGFQLETGAESTYLDGDMTGYVVGETAYRWNGTRHASTSWRSGQTRSGGSYLNLSTYAKILAIAGLGMAQVSNVALPSYYGGAYYQNTVTRERPFTVLLNVNGAGDYAVIQRAREALISAVKPDKTTWRQPVLMQYDELDNTDLELSETLEIKALYENGLEMLGGGDSYNEKIALNFRMFMPLIQQQGEKGVVLGYQQTVADADYILMRTRDGVWQAMAGGMSSSVEDIVVTPDGGIYAVGLFSAAGGVSYTQGIAKWNGTAWEAIGRGADADVNEICVGADGSIYIGGAFTHVHDGAGADVAGTAKIAKWNGTAWSALASGLDGSVYELFMASDGSLYAGGAFHASVSPAVTLNHIGKWNGTAWSALGATGVDDAVSAICQDTSGAIIAGGSFHNAAGVAYDHIAKWDGTAWSGLGSGVNGAVNSLVLGLDKNIYAAGLFTLASGVVGTNHIARWNGVNWYPLGTGINDTAYTLVPHKKSGLLYVGGNFTVAGGVSIADRIAAWNGSTWIPLDVNFPGSPYVGIIAFDSYDNTYVGFTTSGSAVSATVTVQNTGSATVYPKIIFTGAGVVKQLKNYTTGKSVYFNLTLLDKEIAILDFNPLDVSFVSSFRGDILSTIIPGSDLQFDLVPGVNNVSVFYSSGTTANSLIQMVWKDQYWSIDGAVR